jgi:hypothetical protein
MNRITAFTDVEFDEHHTTRRRVNRRCAPVKRTLSGELSVEQQSYEAYKRDPQGTEDRLDAADNQRMSREVPAAVLLGIVAVGFCVLYGMAAVMAIWK